MGEVINIYCDESCHLENDPHRVMVLGAVWCPAERARKIAEDLGALIIPDKTILRHDQYEQDHDTWYCKMYFDMLSVILDRDNRHRIYVDIKAPSGT